MLSIERVSVIFALLAASAASAQVKSACNPSEFFGQITSKSSDLYLSSVLSTINESNYQERKQDLQATVPGYFDGTYSDFEKRRRSFNSRFSENVRSSSSKSFFFYGLDDNGREAYAQCLQHQAQTVAYVYVSTADLANASEIRVKIVPKVIGNQRVRWRIQGSAKPLPGQPSSDEITTGSIGGTAFAFNPKLGFNADFHVQDLGSNASQVLSVEIPALRRLKSSTVYGTDNIDIGCRAIGNAVQNINPVPKELVAPDGWQYVDSDPTRQLPEKANDTKGVSWWGPVTWVRVPTDKPIKLIPTNISCRAGSDGGGTVYSYIANRSKTTWDFE